MKNIFIGTVLLILGVLLLLDNLEIIDFFNVISTYWPVLLIIIGIYYIIRNQRKQSQNNYERMELIHYSSAFNDINLKIDSQNFKGGSISTFLGNITVDLSDAEIAEGQHFLRISSFIGDIFVIVPENSNISFKSSNLIGDLKILNNSKHGLFNSLIYEYQKDHNLNKKLIMVTSQFIGDLKIN